MNRDGVKIVGALLLVVALFVGAIWWSTKMWVECRRVHSWWYCIGEGHK